MMANTWKRYDYSLHASWSFSQNLLKERTGDNHERKMEAYLLVATQDYNFLSISSWVTSVNFLTMEGLPDEFEMIN